MSVARPVPLCTHVAANGLRCRRVPRRGELFCPAHQNRPRLRRERSAAEFEQEIHDYSASLRAQPLPGLLNALFDALSPVCELIPRRAARRDRALYARAMWAVSIALERVEQASRSLPPATAAAPPRPAQPLAPALGPLSADLQKLLDSYSKPQPSPILMDRPHSAGAP